MDYWPGVKDRHGYDDLCGCECPTDLPCDCTEQAELPTSVLDEARKVIAERGLSYDDPVPNHERIAAMWTVILGRDVTPLEVVNCMIAVKLARLVATPNHRDSLVDIAGYAACGGSILDSAP